MKIKLTSEQKRALLFWIIVILISPIAVEAIFLADLLGAELAVGFLWFFVKDMLITWEARWANFKLEFSSSLLAMSKHNAASPKYFAIHYFFSFITLAVTGYLFYVLLIWYPIVIFGGKMSGYG